MWQTLKLKLKLKASSFKFKFNFSLQVFDLAPSGTYRGRMGRSPELFICIRMMDHITGALPGADVVQIPERTLRTVNPPMRTLIDDSMLYEIDYQIGARHFCNPRLYLTHLTRITMLT
jgi:hypothetical protein